MSMYGLGTSMSNHSAAFSSRTDGANGLNCSRCFILALRTSFISALRGSASMLRPPSARGPHSAGPWYHPTTAPSAMSPAVLDRRSALPSLS